MPSMICDAWTSRARTLRSLGESFERSTLISVGAKRPIIRSSFALSGALVCPWIMVAVAPRSASVSESNFISGGFYPRKSPLRRGRKCGRPILSVRVPDRWSQLPALNHARRRPGFRAVNQSDRRNLDHVVRVVIDEFEPVFRDIRRRQNLVFEIFRVKSDLEIGFADPFV